LFALTLLVMGWPAAQAAIPASERAVLLDLYTSTNGASWAHNGGWGGPVGTECGWYGVWCGLTEETVTEVRLDGNNLTGSLPSLAGLTNLSYFSVGANQLTGSIPPLTALTNLSWFLGSLNQLTGSIPALTGLTKLVMFSARANQLSGAIPSLAGLTSLEYFNVSSNQLAGTIPALAGLASLHTLDVSVNQLTGAIPALAGLTNLYSLNVLGNRLSGNVPPAPSPSSLVAGASKLCPNYLSHTADAAWDVATGATPWYSNCAPGPPPPMLGGSVSRKVHGAVGAFDLALNLLATTPTTEPRQGPAHTIVFPFDKPITSGDVAVTEGTATLGAVTFSGSEMRVPLSGVTNQQYVTVAVSNVVAADGGAGGTGSVRVGFLAGDVSQNRVVTLSDLGQVNAQIAQSVTAANYLKDVNASGTLSLADKGLTNQQLTKALPAP
jgi:hypothetical protein